MTYCLGLYLEEGLVLLSDTRTNAGVDNVSTYCKMYHSQEDDERMIVLLSSGNLAVTQAVLHRVTSSNFKSNEDSEKKELPQNLKEVADLYQAAELVGDAVREVYQHDGKALEAQGAGFQVSFLLGGQMRGEPMRLFQIYSAGNFIEATTDTPFLQIGEHKYGKPILDRVVNYQTSIQDGIKLALISMDSTLRSNLSVGMPVDLLIYQRDSLKQTMRRRIDETDPYYQNLRGYWSSALRQAYQRAPDPDWQDT